MEQSYCVANFSVCTVVKLLIKCIISRFSYRNLLKELSRNPPDGVSVGLGEDENMFAWELMIVGPPDTLFEGGFFSAKLDFPPDFPNSPPVMTFKTPMWHPNGTLCSA
jgi:ubiquitin-protein ligase